MTCILQAPPTGKWGKARRQLLATTSDFVCDELCAGARRWSLDEELLVESYLYAIDFIIS